MKLDNFEVALLTVLITGIFWLALFAFVARDPNNYYKKGQVDALTGNVKYELRALPDSTKVWVKIGD